jgi:hypothetical protein
MVNPTPIRRAIDSGRTGDKVDFPDPAAAPLGTDEEAAGTPVPPQAVKLSLDKELNIGNQARPAPGRRSALLLAVFGIFLVGLAVVLIVVSQSLQSS